MSTIRREKLLKKFEEKANWKTENAALLARAKKAEASLASASETIGKVQAKVRDAFDFEDNRMKLPETIAPIVGVEIPKTDK